MLFGPHFKFIGKEYISDLSQVLRKFFLLSIARHWDYLKLFFSVAYLLLILVTPGELKIYHKVRNIAAQIVADVIKKKNTENVDEAIATFFVDLLEACPYRCGALAQSRTNQ